MTFSEALDAIKTGQLATRTAWHGEIFIYIEKPRQVIIDADHPLSGPFPDGYKATHRPYLARKSQGGLIEQYTLCDSDMLTDDWSIVAV